LFIGGKYINCIVHYVISLKICQLPLSDMRFSNTSDLMTKRTLPLVHGLLLLVSWRCRSCFSRSDR